MNHDPQSESPEESAPAESNDTTTPSGDEDNAAVASPASAESAEPSSAEEESPEESPAEEEFDPAELAAAEEAWVDEDDEDPNEDVQPIEELDEDEEEVAEHDFNWYILKVQVNRERSIRDNLERRVKMNGMEPLFQEILVPTEDVVEFTKSGKKRTVKKKLYPGYIMVNMAINDESWFLVRETSGIGDFTTSGGKPTPMDPAEVERIIRDPEAEDDDSKEPVIDMPFKPGDKVRVKDGNFQNFEGEVESIDEAHGRVTVEIELFGRPTPVQLEHWQVESI